MGRGIDLGTRQSRKENPGDSSKKVLLRPLYPSSQAAQGRCHHPIRKARRRQPQGTAGGCPARAWWARRGGHIPLLSAQSSKQHWPPLQMEKLRLGGGDDLPRATEGQRAGTEPTLLFQRQSLCGPSSTGSEQGGRGHRGRHPHLSWPWPPEATPSFQPLQNMKAGALLIPLNRNLGTEPVFRSPYWVRGGAGH